MRWQLTGAVLGIAAVALAGCYHAVVTTGNRPDAGNVVDRPWAHSFIGGLVPPSVTDVQQKCGETGVARVETKLSFVNMVANAVTLGIYTPMHITVTCAQPSGRSAELPGGSGAAEGRVIELLGGADGAALERAFAEAAVAALAGREPVFVRWR